MLKSMTGFGRGEWKEEGLRATVEIRSVNHRFCEIVIRIARPYLFLEERIKEEVQKRVARGHLDIYVNIEDRREKKRKVKLDKELVLAYYNCLRELAEMLQIDFQLNPYQLAQYPDVIIVEDQEGDLETFWPVVQKALEDALDQLILMREREGSRLYEDFIQRRTQIAKTLELIKERGPLLSEEIRSRLKNRLHALLGDFEVDEARLLSEVVLYAERSSIAEEVVRLSCHLEQLAEMLDSLGPVGRKLDFLLQEMNREINTIGAKAGDHYISPLVIEVKSELEKMREQAQNVE
ncbi:MAG: YicC family protein [Bacillota bacterium]|nr:YicC family protein [Bacillota bacterium]